MEYSMSPNQLLEAASDFENYPGVPNDALAKEFLDRCPLPVVINALQTKADVPGLENTLVACLERIFKTKYGASLIPQYMDFVQVGLKADSQIVRCLACKTVTCLLESLREDSIAAVPLILDYGIYPLLLDCLVNGNEQVAAASMDTIRKLAGFPQGMEIIFPANTNDFTHLGQLAGQCSSLGRVRVLALIVKLFAISSSVASMIYKSNLLNSFEAEIKHPNDTLVTLSVLELLYELSEIQHAQEYLSVSTLLQLLSSTIRSQEAVLRSRAMMICGRLLYKENCTFADESSIGTVISAINGRLHSPETQHTDECEYALEALGQIGSSIQGAQLLLLKLPQAARHVTEAAFDGQGRGKQLAALHALANISGEVRSENSMILNSSAEEGLHQVIYETASKTPKLTPSGLILSVLHQDAETRLAVRFLIDLGYNSLLEQITQFEKGYRIITGLVARTWFLMEICSKQEIINIVTDATIETSKIGMETRHNCCKAIQKAFLSSRNILNDPSLAGTAAKVHEAVRRGPYMTKKVEAQPMVVTADRF